jgi:hydroxymethylglutaryl-CoA lyase
MFETMGCNTGVNLDALIECSLRLPAMVGHECPGQVAKAGKSNRRYPAPADLEEIRSRAQARDLADTTAN